MKEDTYLSVFLVMIIICSIFVIKNNEVDIMNDDDIVIVSGAFRIFEGKKDYYERGGKWRTRPTIGEISKGLERIRNLKDKELLITLINH